MPRPPLKLDEDLILKLAQIHCTDREIAAIVGCSVDTLDRRYAELISKGKEQGKMTLRRNLWQLANKGNLSACIWLSKQHLGMRDKFDVDQNATNVNVDAGKVSKDEASQIKQRILSALADK